MLYRTVIIEDDSVITHLNRRYVEMDNRFCVVQTFSAAHPALFWLRSNPVDLIILASTRAWPSSRSCSSPRCPPTA